MSPRATKTDVRQMLERRDFDALEAWASSVRSPQRTLMSLVFDTDELRRWRAIEAYARVTADQGDNEKVRVTLRRILWLMNDESGGLAWYGPEMIAEILARVPHLLPEFAELLPWYLREEPFERGTHYALYRLSIIDAHTFRPFAGKLRPSLTDPDPATRAYAARALKAMGADFDVAPVVDDQAAFEVYDFASGQLERTTVAQFLRSA